jgi:hypothetical protein
MTIEEAKKFGHGVFRIFWKSGGSSLAAVGSLHDGTPWFAPSNWTSEVAGGIASTDWRKVEDIQRLP